MESFKQMSNAEKIKNRAEKIRNSLGFEWVDLEGRSILDVGSGCGEFVQEARKHGIDAYGVDESHPNELRRPERLGYTTNEGANNEGLVVGNADSLPFEDDRFDYVSSHASVPLMGRPTEESISRHVNEMLRVVKVGGEVRISPFKENPPYEHFRLAQEKLLSLYPNTVRMDDYAVLRK